MMTEGSAASTFVDTLPDTRVARIVRWTVYDARVEPITEMGSPPLDLWLRTGEAEIVKDAPHRAVYRVRTDGLDVYIKHDRGRDVRARLRRRILGTKAEREARIALEMARRGIETIAPLASGTVVGGRHRGENYLVTRTIPDAIPLSDWIASPGRRTIRERREIAAALGRFVASLHNAGAFHHDFHCGNILVADRDAQPRFFLIDVLELRLRRRATWRDCLANLAMFNRWLRYKTSRSDRRAFFEAYRRYLNVARPDPRMRGSEWRIRAKEVEQATSDSNSELWERLGRRCRKHSRHFQQVRYPNVQGIAVADLDPQLLQSLVSNPDRWFGESAGRTEVLKASRSSQVVAFDAPCGGARRRFVWKRFRIKAWKEAIAGHFRAGPVRRSWVNGHALLARGLPTPRPLLVLFKHRGGLCRHGYLLFERIEAEGDLHDMLHSLSSLPRRDRQSVLRGRIGELANLIREMHDRGIVHRDLKPANIMYVGSEQAAIYSGEKASILLDSPFCLVDLVGVSTAKCVSFSLRAKNLARLNAGLLASPLVSRTDRLRFLLRYLRTGLHGAAEWKRWWREIERATRAKVAKNEKRGRLLA